ncbi:MAG: hypothetical protein ACLUKN_16815 [Bacilli bacterium]
MSRAQIYLNGKFMGEWPYGYASFCIDVTRGEIRAEKCSGGAA